MKDAARILPILTVSLACALAAPAVQAADAPETVEQLAERAYTQQAAGKFAEAISTYLKAYEISKDALTILNIATIYDRKLKEYALASEYYRRYIMAPDAEPDRVKKVTERLTTLKKEQEDERARALVSPPPIMQGPQQAQGTGANGQTESNVDQGAHSSAGPAMRTAGIVVGAVGLAALAVSIAWFGSEAKSENDSANKLCTGTTCNTQAGVSDAASAGQWATASTATFVSGAVLFVGGIVLFAAAPRSSSSPPKSAHIFFAPSVDRTGAGLTLQGVF